MYFKPKSYIRQPIEAIVSYVAKIKELDAHIREYGNDASPEVVEKYENMVHWFTQYSDDRDNNFVKWLDSKPCSFVHPKTGNKIDILIGNDIEAIVRFLDFCWKLRSNIEVDDDEMAYLAYILARSNSNGEEC